MVGDERRSIRELSEEVATNPDSVAFVDLVAAYRERGDLERALRLCLRGLERHPTHVEAHYELGRIYEVKGEAELAADEWGIVRQLAPDHLPSRLAMVRLYMAEGRPVRAAEELQAAEELAPGDATIAELWKELEESRRAGADADQEERGLFARLREDFPGTLGAMLVDAEGNVLEGHMTPQGIESDRSLAGTLSGAAEEAARVASYLMLGELRAMVIESAVVRLSISPVEDALVVVATACDLPAGQAALVAQRAAELAAEHQETAEDEEG